MRLSKVLYITGAVLAAAFAAVAVTAPALLASILPGSLDLLGDVSGLSLALMYPVRARTLDELKEMASPQTVPGGQNQALPWILYDTQVLTGGTTTTLRFFNAPANNPFVSNVPGSGMLPDPEFFEGWYWGIDVLRPVGLGANDVATGPWNDVNAILQGGIATMTRQQKDDGPFPLGAFRGLNAIEGYGYSQAANAGVGTVQYAQNASLGHWCLDGAWVIPPMTRFSIRLDWETAPATLAATVNLRVWLMGVLHRAVT